MTKIDILFFLIFLNKKKCLRHNTNIRLILVEQRIDLDFYIEVFFYSSKGYEWPFIRSFLAGDMSILFVRKLYYYFIILYGCTIGNIF